MTINVCDICGGRCKNLLSVTLATSYAVKNWRTKDFGICGKCYQEIIDARHKAEAEIIKNRNKTRPFIESEGEDD